MSRSLAQRSHALCVTFTWSGAPAWLAYGIALLIGLAVFAHLYPLGFLAGQGAYFESGDAGQHVSGWQYFVADAWRFPFLKSTRLNHPVGTSVMFTDSIPLAALFFKSISSWLPKGFHYFGIWHLLVFALQGMAATFLLRSLGIRSLASAIAISLLATLWPTLLWRFAHSSLMTHGILLFVLGCYLRGINGTWSPARAALLGMGTAVVSLLIHPYLFAMSFSLVIMYAVEAWRARLVSIRLALAWLGIAAACVALLVLLLMHGVDTSGGTAGTSDSTAVGFGIFSMNLLAPFCNGAFVQCWDLQKSLPQGEGFNYLGAGILLMLVLVVALRGRVLVGLAKPYPVLLIGLALFSAYAVSNRITWGTAELLSIPLPHALEALTGTFRASGRFFWPVGYALLAFLVATLFARRSAWVLPVLAGLVVVQIVDTRPYRDSLTAFASRPPAGDLDGWASALRNVDAIEMYPAYGCDDTREGLYTFAQRLGARFGKTLDTGHIARYVPDCAANLAKFDELKPGRLYLTAAWRAEDGMAVPPGFVAAINSGYCGIHGELLACRAGEALASWQGPLALTTATLPERPGRHWTGSELPGQLSEPQGEHRISASRQGNVSFGPYAVVPPGRYRFVLTYSTTQANPGVDALGVWDIVQAQPGAPDRLLGHGSLLATNGTAQTVSHEFDITAQSRGALEMRTYSFGKADVTIMGLSLQPAGLSATQQP